MIRENIEFSEPADATSDEVVALKDVQYKAQNTNPALLVGLIADFVVPGVGSMVSRAYTDSVARSLKTFNKPKKDGPIDYADSEAFEAAKKKGQNWQQMGNQIAFEMSTTATEILEEGKNL